MVCTKPLCPRLRRQRSCPSGARDDLHTVGRRGPLPWPPGRPYGRPRGRPRGYAAFFAFLPGPGLVRLSPRVILAEEHYKDLRGRLQA